MTEHLRLKWGGLKAWDIQPKSLPILQRYFAEGSSLSAMADQPDAERREILCELIDQLDGDIYLDWDGKYVDKEEAKAYIRNYANG